MWQSLRKALCAFLALALLATGSGFGEAQPPPVLPTVPAPPGPALAQPPQPAISSRITVGPDYWLGPGDTVEVVLAGRVEATHIVAVVRVDGNITVPPMGAIPVAGLTVLQAQRRVASLAQPLFRYLDLSLSLIGTRSFEVTVSGEVERPGTLLLTATDRVYQVVTVAGGVSPRGSLRNIAVLRNGREERRVDLLRFLLAGDLDDNPYVVEGTTVAVPPRGASVALTGAVVRPGEYEIGDAGSLRKLLDLTGGLTTQSAAADARLTRIGPDGKKTTVPLDLAAAVKPPADVQLRAGDVIYVPPLSMVQDLVEVRGAFNGTSESARTATGGKPTVVQRFELASGDQVRDVVVKAGGAAPFADLRMASIERSGPSGPRQTIPVDLHRLLVEKDETQNVPMLNGDVLFLPAAEDKVYVIGEVKSPGALEYRPYLTSREYIALAGGPSSRAKIPATTVTFPNGRTYAMKEAPPLEPGAVVTVPEVFVKWWQDYAAIASTLAGLVTAYSGMFILFGGARDFGRLNE
jgi:protein involved in polysaccharide export with SLBB domain